MKRRDWLALLATAPALAGCAAAAPAADRQDGRVLRGTGDLGLVVQRTRGAVSIVDTSACRVLGEVDGLGDLSHAALVYSRDARHAYVFGRDGGLSRVDLLTGSLVGRVMQAGNSIGGAISADGRIVAAQNYVPGGIRLFDSQSLAPLADIPAESAPGKRSRVVGLVDLPGRRFAFSLFDADAIWIADCSDPVRPEVTRLDGIGRQPYDALVTPDGRHYIAGLFGEDGLAMVDLWAPRPTARRILAGYGRGEQALPVYKMPHLRGWAVAGNRAYLPAVGRHEVLVVDTTDWKEVGRIPVAGQPVFVMARPDGRQVWVSFALPDYHRVQVIDTPTQQVVATLSPGRAIMHMEFTPRGEAIWLSARDDDQVHVFDTQRLERQASLAVNAPSGIFFTTRAHRVGF